MFNMNIEFFLRGLLATLNKIEVKGKENMDCLLGAIMAVEGALTQLATPEETEEDNDG